MSSVEAADVLPENPDTACLVGRVWCPARRGPRVVAVRGTDVFDLTYIVTTMSELMDCADPVGIVRGAVSAAGALSWSLNTLLESANSANEAHLLAPIDLQVVKACGVTFVESMVERVIEERCAGDATRAAEVRDLVGRALGDSISALRPGSEAARQAKKVLIAQGMWSPYLEVGIGPDPEVFTKAPVLSSVGFGAAIGIPTFSSWNNPEPELVLIVDSRGCIRGATLGNDVNLRDVEGRSALLLGKAKDNNASSAIGPFIRLFDEEFTVDTLRTEEIHLSIHGDDGYELHGQNSLSKISRPFEELVSATYGAHHQYPDGFALYTGTLFAPSQDRNVPGQGFTHRTGDTVTIRSAHLGMLVNRTGVAEALEPWTFGIRSLITYLRTTEREKVLTP